MKTGKNDRFIAAIVMLAAGGVLAASGVIDFVEIARQSPAVSRFFLGYTFLVSGLALIAQIRTWKTTSDLVNAISKMKTKQESEQDVPPKA